MPKTSRLEKFIKNFLHEKTAEPVNLYLRDKIIIKHPTQKGSINLAIFWANVLQFPENFPPLRFPYRKHRDLETRTDRLVVTAEGVTFVLNMRTGTLAMSGDLVYEWFTTRFIYLLNNVDVSFKDTWYFKPDPQLDFPELEDSSIIDPYTETEEYILMKTTQHAPDSALEKRVQEHSVELINGVGDLSLDEYNEEIVHPHSKCHVPQNGQQTQGLCDLNDVITCELSNLKHEIPLPNKSENFERREEYVRADITVSAVKGTDQSIDDRLHGSVSKFPPSSQSCSLIVKNNRYKDLLVGDDLENEVTNMGVTSLKDSFTMIYHLWKSLLNKWFSAPETRIFIATPCLDTPRLEDITRLFMQYRCNGFLDTFYVTHKCDPDAPNDSIIALQREVCKAYTPREQTYIEYHIFRKMLCPLQKFGCNFIAGVKAGVAEVMVTSAAFHARHFSNSHLDTVSVLRMPEEDFISAFIQPISAPVAATQY